MAKTGKLVLSDQIMYAGKRYGPGETVINDEAAYAAVAKRQKQLSDRAEANPEQASRLQGTMAGVHNYVAGPVYLTPQQAAPDPEALRELMSQPSGMPAIAPGPYTRNADKIDPLAMSSTGPEGSSGLSGAPGDSTDAPVDDSDTGDSGGGENTPS